MKKKHRSFLIQKEFIGLIALSLASAAGFSVLPTAFSDNAPPHPIENEIALTLQTRDNAQDSTLEDATLQIEAVYSRESDGMIERRSVIRNISGPFRLRTSLEDTRGIQFELSVLKFWNPQGQSIRIYRDQELFPLYEASGARLEVLLTRDESVAPQFTLHETTYAWALKPSFAGAGPGEQYHQTLVERANQAEAFTVNELRALVDQVYITWNRHEAIDKALEEITRPEATVPDAARIEALLRSQKERGENRAWSVERILEIGLPKVSEINFDEAFELLSRLYPLGGTPAFAPLLERLPDLTIEQNRLLFELGIKKSAIGAAATLAARIYDQTPEPTVSLLISLAERLPVGELRDSLLFPIASRLPRITYLDALKVSNLLGADEKRANLLIALSGKIEGLTAVQLAALSGIISSSDQRLRALERSLVSLASISASETQALLALVSGAPATLRLSSELLRLSNPLDLALLTSLTVGLEPQAQLDLYEAHLSRVQGLTVSRVLTVADASYSGSRRDRFLRSILAQAPLPAPSEVDAIMARFSTSESSVEYARALLQRRGAVQMADLIPMAAALNRVSPTNAYTLISEQIPSARGVTYAEAIRLSDLFYPGESRDRLILALVRKLSTVSGPEAAQLITRVSSSSHLSNIGSVLLPVMQPFTFAAFQQVLSPASSLSPSVALDWLQTHHARVNTLSVPQFAQLLDVFYPSQSRDEVILSVSTRFTAYSRQDLISLIARFTSDSSAKNLTIRCIGQVSDMNAQSLNDVISRLNSMSGRSEVVQSYFSRRANIDFSHWYTPVSQSLYPSDNRDTLILELVQKTQTFTVESAQLIMNLMSANSNALRAMNILLPKVANLTSTQLIQLANSANSYSLKDSILEAGIGYVSNLTSAMIISISDLASGSSARERILTLGLARLSGAS